MTKRPIPSLESSPNPASTLHNATRTYFFTKFPEEVRQRIYEFVLREQRSQIVYVETQMPGAQPEFRCTFMPETEAVQDCLQARSSNPSLFIHRLDTPSPYGIIRTYHVSSIMAQLRQRLWNLPLVCRKMHAETWSLGPTPCTFAFPSDLDLRLFLRVLNVESRRHIGGLCVAWQTMSSLMQRMPGLKTVYLWRGVSPPEREAESQAFYKRFTQVVMVG